MKLRECDKRTVCVYPRTAQDDDLHTWGEGKALRAAVYPLGEKLLERAYGERRQRRLLLLYDGGEKLEAGMGVALEGGAPEFIIESLECWSHARAVLREIPEGRRGDA